MRSLALTLMAMELRLLTIVQLAQFTDVAKLLNGMAKKKKRNLTGYVASSLMKLFYKIGRCFRWSWHPVRVNIRPTTIIR